MSITDNITSSHIVGKTLKTITHMEEHEQGYVILMTVISAILFLLAAIALVALRRTKSTPETARFLSSGLLLFDITGTLSFAFRRFVQNPHMNIFVQVLGINCVFVAYVTVGIMSFERLIIFSWPNFYLRCVTPTRVKKIVTTIWILLTVMYFFVRFGVCYILHTDATIYDVIGRCNNESYVFFGVFFALTCIVSLLCYTRIFLIERAKRNSDQPKRMFDTLRALIKYKTTGIVFLYMLCILLTTLSYSCILLFLRSDTYGTRIAADITNMSSCVLDPCLYVLWFRECRFEVMKMFMFSNQRLTQKLEKMRMEIFNVVLSDSKKPFNNRIEPLAITNVI